MENKYMPYCFKHHRQMKFNYKEGYYCELCEKKTKLIQEKK